MTYYSTRQATRSSLLNILKVAITAPRNVSEAVAFFIQESLQLFKIENHYLLTRDGYVILLFSEHLSQANNFCRILRLEKDYSFGKVLPLHSFGDATLLSNENLGDLGFELLYFIYQCYMCTADFEFMGNIADRALRIQRRTELPWDVAHLLANVPDTEMVDQCAFELKNAHLYDFKSEKTSYLASMLCSEDKLQIRKALHQLLSNDAYEALQLDKRGHRYLNALSAYIVSPTES